MKKYIFSLIAATISFLAISNFLKKKTVVPTSILVELEAVIPLNDIFYVYYLQEGTKNWSDENSTYIRIKGSNTIQKLIFEVPIDKKIEKIRIDIGANKKQRPIKIESITLSSEIDKIKLKDSIIDMFSLNVYASYMDGLYRTKEIDGKYDPFLISKERVAVFLENLRTPSKLFSNLLIYFFSSIFAIAFALSIFFSFKDTFFNLLVTGFILIIITPLTVQVLDLKITTDNLEKRELSKFPNLKPITKFPGEFEIFYNDNFGLRNPIIALSGMIKTNVFRSSPKAELVQFGKEGFLFYNSYTDEIFNSYTRNNLLPKSDLEQYYNRIQNRKLDLAQKGIAYVIGFWPNKHTIYPDMMPKSMSTQILLNESLADQITNYFRSKEELYFDVRKELYLEKNKRILYRKLDTHWNNYGAFLGYRSFCKQTHDVLGLDPYNLVDFVISYSKNNDGDLTQQMGVNKIWGYEESIPHFLFKHQEKNYQVISNENYPKGSIVTINGNAPEQKKLLVFRDSFTSQLIQFLSLHYKEVIYVSEIYNVNLIDEYQPDVVLSCRVERYMLTI